MTIDRVDDPMGAASGAVESQDPWKHRRRQPEATDRTRPSRPSIDIEPRRLDVGVATRTGGTPSFAALETAMEPRDDEPTDPTGQRLWVPDNPDGSGWAAVDWASAARGSRYHYRHAEPIDVARIGAPAFYKVVTRLESPSLAPHENSYYVPGNRLADFLAELSFAGGAEIVWHVEPSPSPPPESGVA